MGFTDEEYEILQRAAEALKQGLVKIEHDVETFAPFFLFEGKKIDILPTGYSS